MSTHATLEPARLELAPGDEQTCELTLLNSGRIVEQYRIAALGEAASWITVDPATTNLYPGTHTTVTVRIHPPRTPPPAAGDIPFAVSAIPSGRTAETIAPEGTITVLPLTEVTADVTPRGSRARLRAHHEVTVDNHGNTPVTASIHGVDPDGRLGFRIRPATMTVPAGEAWYARVAVGHRRPLWHGAAGDRPFQLTVECPGQAPVTLDAHATQTAIIPQPVPRLLGRLVAVTAVLLAAWFAVLKPVVASTAKAAVARPVAAMADQVTSIDKRQKAADGAAQAGAKGAAGASAGASGSAGAGVLSGDTARVTLPVAAPAGQGRTTKSDPVPDETTLLITDMFVQNPYGDLGTARILVHDQVILTLSLANFRDTDYHYLTPIQVPAGKRLQLEVQCATPGAAPVSATAGPQCWESLLANGVRQAVPAP